MSTLARRASRSKRSKPVCCAAALPASTFVGAAQQGADARLQLGEVEGLGEVIVGACIEAGDALLHAVERGQHHHRQGGLFGAHLLQHGQAVDQGQAEIEHADVEILLQQQVLGDRAVGGDFDLEAAGFQAGGERIGQDGVVFGEQEFHRAIGCG